jgi:hypothetical protein
MREEVAPGIASGSDTEEISKEHQMDSDATQDMQIESNCSESTYADNIYADDNDCTPSYSESENMQVEDRKSEEMIVEDSGATVSVEETPTQNEDDYAEVENVLEKEIRKSVLKNLNEGNSTWKLKTWRDSILSDLNIESQSVDERMQTIIETVVYEETLRFGVAREEAKDQAEREAEAEGGLADAETETEHEEENEEDDIETESEGDSNSNSDSDGDSDKDSDSDVGDEDNKGKRRETKVVVEGEMDEEENSDGNNNQNEIDIESESETLPQDVSALLSLGNVLNPNDQDSENTQLQVK